MPDPIDELEGFTVPPTTPLPPGEVRRRGDRIRRRNNALAAVGGLAVIAAIATPLAVLADHQGSSAPQPAPAPDWTTTIPASFDMGALPDGASFTFVVRDRSVVDDVRLCGKPAYASDGATDTAGAHWGQPGSEGTAARTLAVYPDEEKAQAALDGLRHAVLACPQEEQGGGAPLVNDPVSKPVAGAEDAFLWTNQAKDGTLLYDTTGYEAVRVGNALYLATAFSSAGEQQANTIDNLRVLSTPVVDQMCVFSAAGCTPASPDASNAVDEPTGLTGDIPGDFPLDQGLPTGAGTLDGPSHQIDLAPYNLHNNLRACGVAPTGLPTPVDWFFAGHRTPAEGHLRTLMTFGSAAEAQTYVENTLVVFANCPQDSDHGVRKVYRVVPGDLGDYTASAVMRVEAGGQPGPGYEVVQLVRVGQAVLRSVVVNDGDPLDAAGADQEASVLVENSQSVVDAMHG